MSARILVVEDDESHRRTLDRHLSRSGYQVLAVETAEQALNQFGRFRPDLVITDIRMPGLDGFDLLEQVRAASPEVDVVLITAYEVMQGAIDAMKRGAYDYLVKPLDLNGLDAVVEACFRDRAARAESRGPEPVPPPEAGAVVLVGRDPRMLEVYKLIGTVARSRAPVLIRGETGTGKELIACTIHENSPNATQPFVAVNCTAIPRTLLESELFGHLKGAFTGAVGDRRGRFEVAGSGTIFLDEIGDTGVAFQGKLLRVLQEREFHPVGGEEPLRTNARVVAATHRPLDEMVERGEFREDLYFRLRVLEILVPPLRERRSDIPLLARHFLNRVAGELGREPPAIPNEVMAELLAHEWPGNVRELENVITRAVVLAKGSAITPRDVTLGPPTAVPRPSPDDDSLASMERFHIQRVLAKVGGNKSQAARLLGISRPRLDRIIEKHGLVV